MPFGTAASVWRAASVASTVSNAAKLDAVTHASLQIWVLYSGKHLFAAAAVALHGDHQHLSMRWSALFFVQAPVAHDQLCTRSEEVIVTRPDNVMLCMMMLFCSCMRPARLSAANADMWPHCTGLRLRLSTAAANGKMQMIRMA